jgi:hypothetical protein
LDRSNALSSSATLSPRQILSAHRPPACRFDVRQTVATQYASAQIVRKPARSLSRIDNLIDSSQ